MNDEVELFLLNGPEAQVPENILKLFEAVTGRKATEAEQAELLYAKSQPGTPPPQG
jgi:hypothetical protein